MASIQKRIPNNAIFVLMKFDSPQEGEKMLDDPIYHEVVGKLQALTIKRGGEFESLANRQ